MEFNFTDPATDFSNALSVITAYHQNFIARGIRLIVLAKEIKQKGMSENKANQCIGMYYHYLNAINYHHKDEELFFQILGNQSEIASTMIDQLKLDHVKIEKSWEQLSKELYNPFSIKNHERFLQLSIEFEKTKRDHLTAEDELFFPKLKHLLTEYQLNQIGQKMSELRI